VENILDNIRYSRSYLNETFISLIKKYAIILSIFLLVGLFLNMGRPLFINLLQEGFDLSVYDTAMYQFAFYIPQIILNIATVVILNGDMQKTGVKSNAVLMLTLFYNEIGVCFFLVLLLFTRISETTDTTQTVSQASGTRPFRGRAQE
jgi:hypothetical protein